MNKSTRKPYTSTPIPGTRSLVIRAPAVSHRQLPSFEDQVSKVKPWFEHSADQELTKRLFWWLHNVYRAAPEEAYDDDRTTIKHVARAASMQLRADIDPELVLGMALFQGLPVIKDDSRDDPWGEAHLGLWPEDVRLQCLGKWHRHCGHVLQREPWPQDAPLRCHVDCPAGRWTVAQSRNKQSLGPEVEA